jgi:hypothetical protein
VKRRTIEALGALSGMRPRWAVVNAMGEEHSRCWTHAGAERAALFQERIDYIVARPVQKWRVERR